MKSCVVSAFFSDFPSVASSHWHDCHQLIYIAKGSAKITIGDKIFPVKEGTVAVFNRFEEHSFLSEKNGCERYIIRISPEKVYSLSKDAAVLSVLVNRKEGFENLIEVGGESEDFEYVFKKIIKEYNSKKLLSDELINSYVKEILVMISRFMPESFLNDDTHMSATLSKLRHILETEYSFNHTLENLSERFSVSPSYMSHMFKEFSGVSVIKYLNNCRMNVAKRLLLTTEKPVKEIVEECGFSDESNFCRSFKILTGVTPVGFRKGSR